MKYTVAAFYFVLIVAFCGALDRTAMAAATVSQWLPVASGNWTTASNWSTNPSYPNNGSPTAADQYNVLINQTGAPYTVTLVPAVTVNTVKLDSPDATLQLVDGLKTNSLDVTNGTVTLGTTSCCGHSLDVFDDITLNNGSIRLVMSQDQSQPTLLRF